MLSYNLHFIHIPMTVLHQRNGCAVCFYWCCIVHAFGNIINSRLYCAFSVSAFCLSLFPLAMFGTLLICNYLAICNALLPEHTILVTFIHRMQYPLSHSRLLLLPVYSCACPIFLWRGQSAAYFFRLSLWFLRKV